MRRLRLRTPRLVLLESGGAAAVRRQRARADLTHMPSSEYRCNSVCFVMAWNGYGVEWVDSEGYVSVASVIVTIPGRRGACCASGLTKLRECRMNTVCDHSWSPNMTF